MKIPRTITLFTALFLVISVSGCGSAPGQATQAAEPVVLLQPDEIATLTTQPTRIPKPTPTGQYQGPPPVMADFDAANFENSTEITNEWLPFKPGTRWVYEGTALDHQQQQITRRIEFTITDLTKEIDGVETVVAWILDFNNGELVEKEIAFYAQDKEGTVWYLGEHPEEYEAGAFVQAPTWIAGLREAKAGIKMKAQPEPGAAPIFQGWGPEVEWADFGMIYQIGQKTCVPVGCYEDVVVNAESSPGEGDAFQLKYYARGVGEVQVGWKGNDKNHETLQLIEFVQLDPDALAEVRSLALEVEKHAYEISPDLYGQTPPME